MEPWAEALLAFWFGQEPERWWKPGPEFDAEVRERFEELWREQQGKLPAAFLGSPREALAAIILFDQFPRNMFRDHADQFATDHLALAIAKGGVERGFDERFEQPQRGFFYMPYQHSEELDDQRRSVALFTELGDDYQLGFARKHLDVIERFGRFPHRNAILGRAPRPDEIAAGDVVPW